jgi:hypothetical protein
MEPWRLPRSGFVLLWRAPIGTRQEFDKVRLYITALPLLSLNADPARSPTAPRPKQRAEPPDRTNLI